MSIYKRKKLTFFYNLFIIYNKMQRGRAVAARQAHNLEAGGSNPPPATKINYETLAEKNGRVAQW